MNNVDRQANAWSPRWRMAQRWDWGSHALEPRRL